MKKIIILLLSISFGNAVYSQQLPQLTQYMINNYAVNPAIAGMYDYYQVNTAIRNQWVGINDAPRTTILSIYGKKSDRIGLGGVVYNDQTGPTSRVGGNMSYTYHLDLSGEVKVAFALAGGFTQLKISKRSLNFENPNGDPAAEGGDLVRSVPDATFGFNTYGKNWYVGLSIPQLLNSNVNLLDQNFRDNWDKEGVGQLVRHYYVLGAYKHQIDPFWSVEPSFLLKSVSSSTQFDFGVKGTYDDRLWFGADYRTNGEIACLLGYTVSERYIFGYSYDIPSSDMSNASTGSHEFMLGIRFITNTESEIMKMR